MSVERDPGVWIDVIVEKSYIGNVVKNTRRWESRDSVNDNLKVNNQISVVADSFCHDHLFQMKYITWMGTKWKIESVDILLPRIVITLGGVWNGSESEAKPDDVPEETGGTP